MILHCKHLIQSNIPYERVLTSPEVYIKSLNNAQMFFFLNSQSSVLKLLRTFHGWLNDLLTFGFVSLMPRGVVVAWRVNTLLLLLIDRQTDSQTGWRTGWGIEMNQFVGRNMPQGQQSLTRQQLHATGSCAPFAANTLCRCVLLVCLWDGVRRWVHCRPLPPPMLIALIIILWLPLTFAAPWTVKIKFSLCEFYFLLGEV